ncbi:MAG: TIGR03086 family metal-binding protein [Pseudonocardiaceae bacterium]
MTTMHEFDPQALQVAALLPAIADEQLSAPTPCEEFTVSDLLDHLLGLTVAFRDAATKTPGTTAPADDWRSGIPRQLDALAAAWRDPAAWEGTTEAGGVELPAEEMGTVALNELVIHGWDLARATGQPYEPDPAATEAICAFLSAWENPEGTPGLFGPVVQIASDAPLLDRALGLTGRDPSWTP